MSALAIVGGIAMAVFVSPLIAEYLNEIISPTRWTPVIAFLVVFLVVYIVVKIVEKLLDGIFDRLNLERLDKALGLFLGIAEGIVAVCLIVYVIDIQPFFEPSSIFEGSRAAEWAHILLPEAAQFNFDNII